MKRRYVCLCGSSRYKSIFDYLEKIYTLLGWIVLRPGIYEHAGDMVTEEEKEGLDRLHRMKIELADLVVVINPTGYIGNSTSCEIEFAKTLNKKIIYLEEP